MTDQTAADEAGAAQPDPEAVVRQPRQIPVDFGTVLNRAIRHYADENARIVSQLTLAQEENNVLHTMLDECERRIGDLEQQHEALLAKTAPPAKARKAAQ